MDPHDFDWEKAEGLPEEAPLGRIFAGDREPIAAVSRTVIECGACDEVRSRARAHTRRAIDALEAVAKSPARSLLESVAGELAERAA